MKIRFVEVWEDKLAHKCDWCKKDGFKEGYFIEYSNEKEFEAMTKKFPEFEDTPILFCCEDCMEGRCKDPKIFFIEEFMRKEEHLTEEQIWDSDGGVFTGGDDELRTIISKYFTFLPIEVIDYVMDNCLIFMVRYDRQKGCAIYKDTIKNKGIILLAEGLLNNEKELKDTLLHEVAHCWLKHKVPINKSCSEFKEQYEKQEEEADKLVGRWLE